MKKLVVLFGIALLCGCTTDIQDNYTVDNDNNAIIYNTFEDAFKHHHKVNRFYENGHTYIMFTNKVGYRGYMGVVHDPDCKKCNNK